MPPTQTPLIFLFLFLAYRPFPAAATNGGTWQLLQKSIGISAMHMQLLHNDRLITFDRTDFGRSNLSLPQGKCRNDPRDTALTKDCTAHSVEYDVLTNTFRPLMVLTDVWCSSGSVLSNGQLVQTGGFNDGEQVVRVFTPCDDGRCDWEEIGSQLLRRRWYATNQALPDGRMIIIGGRKQFNYEYYPKKDGGAGDGKLYGLRFLAETNDPKVENNLYPFVFLNVDGNLFIFANNRAVLFNYRNGTVVRSYPVVPGGDPRSYPSTGSAVLLPLKNLGGAGVDHEAEVLVCGGAPRGSFEEVQKGRFIEALKTCARIKINDPNPEWVLETMPSARAMGDMLLLPNGNVLIINGVGSGTAGWESGRDAVLKPVIYDPSAPSGSRFEVQNPTTIPRVYHSAAVLVRDGRVIVGGSNPHIYYNFSNALYPTELSLEAFSPSYLDQSASALRPRISFYPVEVKLWYGGSFTVRFSIKGSVDRSRIKVTMVSPSFNTHSFSQGQRLLELSVEEISVVEEEPKPPMYQVGVKAPGSPNLSPPGYYMLFVVYKGIPSEGIWVRVGKLEK